jgi:outer membrane protein OmpA-like peptidoglycan-associated protein
MGRPRHKYDENYIAFSDIMTCLMIIFLFIAISYIMEVFSSTFVKDKIYNTIGEEMIEDLDSVNAKLGKDLSIRFFNSSNSGNDTLFRTGDYRMTEEFRRRLDLVWPKYQNIITKDSFLNYIGEIRIEGHTDTMPPKYSKVSSYEYNLNLSSLRAQEVLNYIRGMECYVSLDSMKRKRLDFLMTANGMSFSRILNDSSEVVYLSKNKNIDSDKSRRVEFRIVSTNERLIQKLTKD